MRSYYSHLSTINYNKKNTLIEARPIFRASAIFPAMHTKDISSRLLFMGYWLLKRNIAEIQCVVTLRFEDGRLLARTSFSITEAKAFRIELLPFLEQANLLDKNFLGSFEVEFFSSQNLVFPFPAAVINYYGDHFSTVVHTAQRVYNDFEDLENNSQTKVPESGFTIYKDVEREPFLSLINGGAVQHDSKMDFTFFNHKGETLTHTKALGDLSPYQALFLYPAREIPELEHFLGGFPGTCKVGFNVSWIFPRLLVGNFLHHPFSFAITHSYYDCSAATKDSDYWTPSDPAWFPESLMIPILQSDQMYTQVAFYPIYSPSMFSLDIEIYNQKGSLLGSLPDYIQIKTPSSDFLCLSFKEILTKMNLGHLREPLGARLAAKNKAGEKIPTRIKVAFDIGFNGKALPCNICTNLQPYNPALKTKTQSFKWGPLLSDMPGSSVWIMNSQPKIDYQDKATIALTFYREQDTQTLLKEIVLVPEGFAIIDPDNDPELQAFLNGQIGWFTAISTNPYTTTYYFSMNRSGVVGGDHGF
ncbi:Uncharacterized protein PHSC3_000053 [Chlamydiales bacterium STE3]|nr:Uncharacterized protein PHSC3_000053 [Chlamydiales bacterium STE3]